MTNTQELFNALGLSKAEQAENELKAKIISALLNARKEQNITQTEWEELSGIGQPMIARIERNKVDPQISTILRLLVPLGKTLDIVPIEL
jgi:predicted transcriptional regulator